MAHRYFPKLSVKPSLPNKSKADRAIGQSESSPHSSVSEQTLPSESLSEVKEAVKAEHSKTGKATRGIKHSETQSATSNDKKAWRAIGKLSHTPHKIIDRKATYLSRSTWERLEFVCPSLGRLRGRMFRVSWRA
ncbi:hypothetical protein OK18_00015 [Chryseobacterium gallinarum]|uniref:Uncharacterized protein n=1 Tax=Chryseobacterium gallinarum TaxID=1324352 RepID=A0A0G3LWA2_CHRGL|nr:hypothetical protein OK18_00015 [Chryseobacterium gallinarum]